MVYGIALWRVGSVTFVSVTLLTSVCWGCTRTRCMRSCVPSSATTAATLHHLAPHSRCTCDSTRVRSRSHALNVSTVQRTTTPSVATACVTPVRSSTSVPTVHTPAYSRALIRLTFATSTQAWTMDCFSRVHTVRFVPSREKTTLHTSQSTRVEPSQPPPPQGQPRHQLPNLLEQSQVLRI